MMKSDLAPHVDSRPLVLCESRNASCGSSSNGSDASVCNRIDGTAPSKIHPSVQHHEQECHGTHTPLDEHPQHAHMKMLTLGALPHDGKALDTKLSDVAHLSGSESESDAQTAVPPDYEAQQQAVDGEAGTSPRGSLTSRTRRLLRTFRPLIHLFLWLLVTAWWLVGLILYRNKYNWVEPMLLWMLVTFRFITFYIPARHFLFPFQVVWRRGVSIMESIIPERLRTLVAAIVVAVALLLGVFIPPDTVYNSRTDRTVSVFGYLVFLLGLYLTSRHRQRINWKPVIVGILAQFILGFFVLQTTLGKSIFRFLADALIDMLSYAYDGVIFLTAASVPKFGWYLVNSLSIITFFVALVQALYHVGFVQWGVAKLAYCFGWALHLSGAEALAASVTPFLGMGEAPIVLKGFIGQLTRAEIHQVMTNGFATISGSLAVVYTGFGANGQAVISSCLMSIPISVAISKMRVPETETPQTFGPRDFSLDEKAEDLGENGGSSSIGGGISQEVNILHALSNGAWTGLKVAGMVAANLIVILATVALCNGILEWIFKYTGLPQITISQIFGYLFYPVAFLMGVPRSELYLVGQLLGDKTIQNEFVAFSALTQQPQFVHLSARATVIATYALCGFANLGSIGIQLGIYGQLAPRRRGDFAREAISACVCGALATFMSACLAGMIFTV